jgi:two-component system response regulator FlrC
VRIVAATNRDLRAEVAARRFREDLFYRLNVFAVRLPPLRERPDDIEPLVRHFLPRLDRGAEWAIDDEALAALRTHRWPGNVRELANICATLAVRAGDAGRVTREDLEHVWHRQHPGETAPWRDAPTAPRGRLGEWVIERARESRFNLIEVSRLLRRRKRAGQPAPLTERSAISYYVTGEILSALVAAEGDADAAARAIAGDEELLPRVAARVAKVIEAVRAADGDRSAMRRRFGKLPAGYEGALERVAKLIV